MDFWTWARAKALNVVIAAYAVMIVLQLVFGAIFDIVTNIIVLVLLVAISRLSSLERWWRGSR